MTYELKVKAAEKAIEYVENGMIVGLGTGSTVNIFIEKLIQRVKAGLKIKVVSSSISSEKIAFDGDLDLIDINQVSQIDLTVDGTDQVDDKKDLIKGRGGALYREKILAFFSEKFLIITDESKRVDFLKNINIPVEVDPFCHDLIFNYFKKEGYNPTFRLNEEKNFYKTDSQNYIIDIFHHGIIQDVLSLEIKIKSIPGVIETGIFYNFNPMVIIASSSNQIEVF